MTSRHSKLAGAALAIALCASPTVATAATSAPVQQISPLVAISVFGTQASAQEICASGAAAAAAAGAAAAAQARAGCVLPVMDAVARPPVSDAVPPPPPPSRGYGFNPILAGLAGLALLGGILAALSDDDDIDAPVSPA